MKKGMIPIFILIFIVGGLLTYTTIAQTNVVDLAFDLREFSLEVARGNINGTSSIDKFGRSNDVDSGDMVDIWDGAGLTYQQDEWIAPTQARIHNVASTSGQDTLGGNGANQVKLYGLTSWTEPETSEVINLSGTTDVETQNAYVIIHRAKVISQGSNDIPNTGDIIFEAQTDLTDTAIILAGEGQTQMAIYGIPEGVNMYMNSFYMSILRRSLGTSEAHADMNLLVNEYPEENTESYIIKHSLGIGTRGSNPTQHFFVPQKKFEGPAIIKLQAVGSANNLDVSGGFDAYLIQE